MLCRKCSKQAAIKGMVVNHDDFNRALNIYYEMMGWPHGMPSTGKLGELGINWVLPKADSQY